MRRAVVVNQGDSILLDGFEVSAEWIEFAAQQARYWQSEAGRERTARALKWEDALALPWWRRQLALWSLMLRKA